MDIIGLANSLMESNDDADSETDPDDANCDDIRNQNLQDEITNAVSHRID